MSLKIKGAEGVTTAAMSIVDDLTDPSDALTATIYEAWQMNCTAGDEKQCAEFWSQVERDPGGLRVLALAGIRKYPPKDSSIIPGATNKININNTNNFTTNNYTTNNNTNNYSSSSHTTIDNRTVIVFNPPKQIYPSPDAPIGTQVVTVELPERRLSVSPNPNSTNASSKVFSSFAKRKWGNLLNSPISGVAEIETANVGQVLQDFVDSQATWQENLVFKLTNDFLNLDLTNSEELTTIGSTILNGKLVGNIKKYYDYMILSSHFSGISASGTVPSEIKVTTKTYEAESSANTLPLTIETYSGDTGVANLAIPIRNYRMHLPNNIGHKRELQIIFVRSYSEVTKDRQITIPNPTNLTPQLILAKVGSSLTFGDCKYECDVVPYGKITFYGNEDLETEVEAWFNSLLELSNGTMVPDSFRSSRRKRNFLKGTFVPYVAYSIDFSLPGLPCTKFDLKNHLISTSTLPPDEP